MTVTCHTCCGISQAGAACRQAASVTEMSADLPGRTARKAARAGRLPG